MILEYKDQFETKIDIISEEEGKIEGYGAFFNNVDSHNDIILPGAFKETIKSFKSKQHKITLNSNHWYEEAIGRIDELWEDAKGLKMKATIVPTTLGLDTRILVKEGITEGLSIGYNAIKSRRDEKGIRYLSEVYLSEISCVINPSNKQCQVESYKSMDADSESGQKNNLEQEYLLAKSKLLYKKKKYYEVILND